MARRGDSQKTSPPVAPEPGNRTAAGRFPPGVSGNPNGRPKAALRIAELAREHAESALQKLVDLLDNENPKIQLDAAEALLNRGFGRPAQSVSLAGDPDNPVGATVFVVPSSCSSMAEWLAQNKPEG